MIKLSFVQIFKTVAHASIAVSTIVLGLSQEVKAGENSNRGTIHISQDPFGAISNISADSDRANFTDVAQGRRRRQGGRGRNSKIEGYYAGFSGGIGFLSGSIEDTAENLSDPEYSNAFLGSIFGGVKFSKYISADLEFILGVGGANTDDLEADADADANFTGDLSVDGDYAAFGLYLNPRFELPLDRRDRLNLYLSPGLGISQTNVNLNFVNFDETSDVDPEFRGDFDASQLGISFQIKGGASFAIRDNIVIFAQARYVDFPTEDELNPNSVVTDLDPLNIFSTELGLKLRF